MSASAKRRRSASPIKSPTTRTRRLPNARVVDSSAASFFMRRRLLPGPSEIREQRIEVRFSGLEADVEAQRPHWGIRREPHPILLGGDQEGALGAGPRRDPVYLGARVEVVIAERAQAS